MGSLRLLPWQMKTYLPCGSYAVTGILLFPPEQKSSFASVRLWNRFSRNTKNSFPLYGSAHPWAFLKSTSTHNHMSKRGSPYLRHAIFLAATTCSFHNSPLNAYYKKKREQGKHHLTATGAVARKLTTVIYAVLRDGKPYEPKSFC